MFTEMMASGMGVPVFVGKAHVTTARRTEQRARERAKPFGTPLSRFSKKHPSKRIQTKEMVGHGCPALFLNFKGLKNE
ncbi:hypothetical protein HMPREF2600_04205 [Neisseria sp. HMSC077D05]|nr:hypothetical protein HMPREF2600_04205 [Neisseria sp. HMSC077D05]